MIDNKEVLQDAKEAGYKALRYFARYGFNKTIVCQIMGQKIADIYITRGFVEISRDEFDKLVQEMKASRV